jgi:hypothetical protein
MAQRIKVQDGRVYYSASDPADDVNIGVAGQINVTKQVNVGDDPSAAGLIQTPVNSSADLIFRTSTDGIDAGNIKFEPSAAGNILFNNVAWPDGSVVPVPGMFLGVSGVNTLQFLVPPGGSGSISAPLNEVVYGTGPGVTTDSDFVYDSSISTLSVGSVGTGEVKSNIGDALIVDGDLQLILKSGTGTIDVQSELLANSLPGIAGDVLTNQGAGQPPTWQAPSGGSASIFSVRLDNTSATFNGNVNTFWATADELVTASYCQWDSYTSTILFNEDGVYRISIISVVMPDPSTPDTWPDDLVSYGSSVSSSLTMFNTRYSTYAPAYPGNFQALSDFTLAPDQSSAVWTDTYIFNAVVGDSQSVGVYAASYSYGSTSAVVSAVATVEKLGP